MCGGSFDVLPGREGCVDGRLLTNILSLAHQKSPLLTCPFECRPVLICESEKCTK